MANYITVDGGTTNTRLYLVRNGCVADTVKLTAGIKAGLSEYKKSLSKAIDGILKNSGLKSADIARIIASGMITSEYGLCELPHISTPAGKSELRRTVYETRFEDVTDIPWVFIRGVKTSDLSLEGADMVRGEETEVMGLIEGIDEDTLFVLPGSHSKHISVDKNGSILDIRTMLSGELFAAVTQSTILRDTVDLERAVIIEDSLKRGYEYCASHGINEALFKTRVLKNMLGATAEECYSFLLGDILYGEVRAILDSPHSLIVIGGQKHFRKAITVLLKAYGSKRVVTLDDRTVDASVALGAVRVYETEQA